MNVAIRWARVVQNQGMVINVEHEDNLSLNIDYIRGRLKAGAFREAQSLCIEAIRTQPTNAQLWVFLGESLECLDRADVAWSAYERAWLLDPQAGWVSHVKSRLQPLDRPTVPNWLRELLEVPKVSVSAAIIAKDEERTIGAAVSALVPAVDEIIVVDTGSTDNTANIARASGARVFSYDWTDDFSAARNFALSKVSGSWVLFVDADEVLDEEDRHCPRVAAGIYSTLDCPVLLRIVQVNTFAGRRDPNYDMTRLFPTQYGLRWWGRIHEQVGGADGIYATQFLKPVVRIRLNHDGYDPKIMTSRHKLERNIRLLRRALEENPKDIGSMGFLGRELYLSRQFDEAVRVLYEAEQLATEYPMYARLPEVRGYLLDALVGLNRLHEAVAVGERAVKHSPNYPRALYGLGRAKLALSLKLIDEAFDAFTGAIERAPSYRGYVSYDSDIVNWRAFAALGDIWKLRGDWVKARTMYERALQGTGDNLAVINQLEAMQRQARAFLDTNQRGGRTNAGE